jgi:hypothetical protein
VVPVFTQCAAVGTRVLLVSDLLHVLCRLFLKTHRASARTMLPASARRRRGRATRRSGHAASRCQARRTASSSTLLKMMPSAASRAVGEEERLLMQL